MKRGEVWWVNFEPALGSEIRKKRPAVIVSNDVANTSNTSEIRRAVTVSGMDFPKCPTNNAIGVVMSTNGSAARNLTSPRRALSSEFMAPETMTTTSPAIVAS